MLNHDNLSRTWKKSSHIDYMDNIMFYGKFPVLLEQDVHL